MSNNIERDNAQRKQRRLARKKMAIQLLGGKCVNCGSTERLEFDHIDNDRIGLRGLISQRLHNKVEFLLDELEKCQLLCKSCHVQKSIIDHDKLQSTHGMLSMYINNKCRCDDCRSANNIYMRRYKQKRRLA
jgi:hypothetical protein